MNRALILGLLLAVAAAMALRCPQLDARPMHNDESVNAIKLRQLWEHGAYQYDPTEYHGPTLPYLSYVWMKCSGTRNFVDFTETQLRMLTVVFGAALILLLVFVADGLGNRATVCAAFLTAISPAMVFYSRYYIHEMLLVFFTLLAIGAAWRYSRNSRLGWALLAGAAVALMQTTKETFVLTIAAGIGAFLLNTFWGRDEPTTRSAIHLKHVIYAYCVWFVIVVFLFTSFFTNVGGLADSVRTYFPWLHRVEGASPHIHGWNFYLERLFWFHTGKGPIWTEALIGGLALIGFIAVFARRNLQEGNAAFIRFIAFYTLLLTAMYCIIGYKTPWCLLSFWNGMILLAGFGVATLFDSAPSLGVKLALAIFLLAAASQLTWQSWQLATTYAADQRNPYIYGQTSPSILDLADKADQLAQVSPQKYDTVIKVMSPDGAYWPLPWYLRRFDHVGYWSEMPKDSTAPIVILSTKLQPDADFEKTNIMAGIFELRPQVFLQLYVETNLWSAHVAANSKK